MACAALVVATGCSESPTTPSPVFEIAATPRASNLRWDIVAPGCEPAPAPSPLPSANDAQLTPDPAGGIRATWRYTSEGGRPGLLNARFVESGELLLLCSWDISDL